MFERKTAYIHHNGKSVSSRSELLLTVKLYFCLKKSRPELLKMSARSWLHKTESGIILVCTPSELDEYTEGDE